MNDGPRASLLRWLRRQLAQPTPVRERLEAAVANDDPAEARRLLTRMPFSEQQRGHLDSLLARWEAAAAEGGAGGRAGGRAGEDQG
jgi:hypothetical protein